MATNKTYERRLDQLLEEINNHAHKAELIKLMSQQLLEDTEVIHADTCSNL